MSLPWEALTSAALPTASGLAEPSGAIRGSCGTRVRAGHVRDVRARVRARTGACARAGPLCPTSWGPWLVWSHPALPPGAGASFACCPCSHRCPGPPFHPGGTPGILGCSLLGRTSRRGTESGVGGRAKSWGANRPPCSWSRAANVRAAGLQEGPHQITVHLGQT